ncbi:MAG: hypothetical protein OHK93_003152 [Ramalina farinacea]|uniref:Uncharacterized protein n=1 Tax=Ramalina farinacea TaxID=258253 RepID=A0AA43TUF5_9LECA|nr:hypothetical protein [Ramalina farinacea]
MTSTLLIVFLSLSYASATSYTPNATSVDCQLASAYQHANASAQFNVPAVTVTNPIKAGFLNTSETDHWTVTNALSVSSKAYPPDTNPLLESAIFLDVSSTLRSPSDAKEAGLSGCAFTYRLPASDLGKTDNGSCKSLFDDACLNDFISDAIDWIRRAIFEGDGNEEDADICESLYQRLLIAPDSCNKFKAEGSTSLGLGIMDHSRELLTPPLP